MSRPWSFNFDFWSLGVIIYEIFNNKHPFIDISFQEFNTYFPPEERNTIDFRFNFASAIFNRDHYIHWGSQKDPRLNRKFLDKIKKTHPEHFENGLNNIPECLLELVKNCLVVSPQNRHYSKIAKIILDEAIINENINTQLINDNKALLKENSKNKIIFEKQTELIKLRNEDLQNNLLNKVEEIKKVNQEFNVRLQDKDNETKKVNQEFIIRLQNKEQEIKK